MFKKLQLKLRHAKIKKQAQLLKDLLAEHSLELVVKDRYGVSYDLKSDYNLRHFLQHDTYFDGSIAELISQLKSQSHYKLVLDVGANKGMTAAFLASFTDQVIAFEPESSNIEKFKRTMSLNPSQNVELVTKAVSDKDGEVTFFIAPGEAHHSLGLAHPGQNQNRAVKVPCITLDTFCAERKIENIDILKVDVEGFESSVFKGAQNLLKNKKIKNILFEISMGVMERLQFDPAEPLKLLESYDYKIANVDGQAVSSQDIYKYGGQDLLATPR